MNALLIVFSHVIAFFLLTPGILLTLPPRASKYVVAITHATIFGLLAGLSHHFILTRMMAMKHGKKEGHIGECRCKKMGL